GDSARTAMDLVYRQGGSTSYKRESRLAECWRDLHVVGQAVTIMPEWYPIGGRGPVDKEPGPRAGWQGAPPGGAPPPPPPPLAWTWAPLEARRGGRRARSDA